MATDASREAILRVADVVGRLMEFWGFKRNMGRLWCVLFLEKKPLSAADLGERLSLSTGAISMTLSELSKWGVVRKAFVPGERRDYYEPETDVWKMVSRVFRERELEHVRASMIEMERASEILGDDSSDANLVHARRQIESLLTLAKLGETLIENVVAGDPVQAAMLAGYREDE